MWSKNCLGCLAMLLVPICAVTYHQSLPDDPATSIRHDLGTDSCDRSSCPSHQRKSLLKPYSVDYDEVLKEREELMKKYTFNYSVDGIDRRSGLSLQEYFDVYDGKW